jgi:hypothetical protein
MANAEIFTLKSSINKTAAVIKKLRDENNSLDDSISQLKTENKSLYNSEYQLIHMILQYEKKLHEFANSKQNYLSNLNSLKMDYLAVTNKLSSLREIKSGIIESNRNKIKHYMRVLYKLNIRNEKRVNTYGSFSLLEESDPTNNELDGIIENIKLKIYTRLINQFNSLRSSVLVERQTNEEKKAYLRTRSAILYNKVENSYPDIVYPVASSDVLDIDKLKYYKSKLDYLNKKFNLDLAIVSDDLQEQSDKLERTEKQLENILLAKRNLKIKKK